MKPVLMRLLGTLCLLLGAGAADFKSIEELAALAPVTPAEAALAQTDSDELEDVDDEDAHGVNEEPADVKSAPTKRASFVVVREVSSRKQDSLTKKVEQDVQPYGPAACVRTFKDQKTNTCIMKTSCKAITGFGQYDMGFRCARESDNDARAEVHMFGAGSFAEEETFDSKVACLKCLPLEDKSYQTVGDLASQVLSMRQNLAIVESSVDRLNKKAVTSLKFPSTVITVQFSHDAAGASGGPLRSRTYDGLEVSLEYQMYTTFGSMLRMGMDLLTVAATNHIARAFFVNRVAEQKIRNVQAQQKMRFETEATAAETFVVTLRVPLRSLLGQCLDSSATGELQATFRCLEGSETLAAALLGAALARGTRAEGIYLMRGAQVHLVMQKVPAAPGAQGFAQSTSSSWPLPEPQPLEWDRLLAVPSLEPCETQAPPELDGEADELLDIASKLSVERQLQRERTGKLEAKISTTVVYQKKAKKRLEACLRLQRYWRSFRCVALRVLRHRCRARMRLQRWFRALSARRVAYRRLRALRALRFLSRIVLGPIRSLSRARDRIYAVSYIGARWRGSRARTQAGLRCLQAVARGAIARRRIEQLAAASEVICKHVRNFLCRRLLKRLHKMRDRLKKLQAGANQIIAEFGAQRRPASTEKP
ncbi:unnamed protein product [Durusdinium trenchii]|uniref:Uncharacterized protein n=2 Tax=Durusdinium trenchii TaxID=1381693 RepID=A0ABP0J2K9_9DINO